MLSVQSSIEIGPILSIGVLLKCNMHGKEWKLPFMLLNVNMVLPDYWILKVSTRLETYFTSETMTFQNFVMCLIFQVQTQSCTRKTKLLIMCIIYCFKLPYTLYWVKLSDIPSFVAFCYVILIEVSYFFKFTSNIQSQA